MQYVAERNGKIVRQELSEWLLVANNGSFPVNIILLLSRVRTLQETPY